MASISASALAASCSIVNDRLPIGVWMLPALSTRNSTLPAFASRTARAMSKVTVPSFGFGMRPRGPSTLPSRPTCPMRSGVAMVVSNSMKPPWTFSTRSSAPMTSAPASRASRSFSPLAKTATRTVLPMPCGSTTAPRTIWSACFGSTPSRNERSTDSSNFAAGMPLSVPMASSTEYGFAGSTFAAAASYRLLTTVAISLSPRQLQGSPRPRRAAAREPTIVLASPSKGCGSLNHINTHAAGGALDDPHRGIDRVRVEVHQLGLGDLAHLLPGDLADLVLVRHRGGLRDAGRALEQHGRRRRLHDEGEGPILVDGHHHRQDQPFLVVGLRVEALAELHDVDAVLTERRPHRRRRVRLAGRNLQLHHRLDFLH